MNNKTERLLSKNSHFLTRGHDFVEIGGIKWATMNIGANSITDAGLYFQWGDTQGYTASEVGTGSGQKAFSWDDYKYCGGAETSSSAMTKYNSIDGKRVLDLGDDAAHAAWGGAWRMPTIEEFVALGNAVNSAWTTNYEGSGVAGFILTDKTDSSKVLFFPAVGRCSNGNVDSVGGFCFYWSSSRGRGVEYAHYLYFYSSFVDWHSCGIRFFGHSVRGVLG